MHSKNQTKHVIIRVMLFEHCIMLHLSYVALQTEPMSTSKPHILLLSACLHFMSLKIKFIYSIITHFSKLFSHCQRNLLPSALMAAQFSMVDGYLIGETTAHRAQEVKENWEKGKDKNQEHKITSPVYFMPIHGQILDRTEKCFHLYEIRTAIIFRI